ncbi:hypothetical protein DPMN_005364 [Dreissena polymorpha]|uniref:Uncharacterized protein n=1 Tax=Dreissena polymorpha TaxID=45954 RepID=A0A9D4MS22_DREPO|nr:hypothetical protein DPMN_005364 [Dreissena polymorpha]
MRGESIASLADDIRQLAQKAYADLDSIAVERLALNQLYKQISGDMHCSCIDNNCHTVNDAVSVIERYQSHILGPFRQTSDKYLEGDSMNTHFGSGIAVYLRGPTRIKIT